MRGKPQSYAAISTCNGGINGFVFDGSEIYFIQSGNDGQLGDQHFLLK